MDTKYKVKTAVAVVIFNRVDKAKTLYGVLKKVQPSRLYVIADGPRNEEETEKCMQTRMIFENIEWPCEISRNYSEKNMGCCMRPQTGFTWVLENESEAIFLEDDCIPCVEFFRFCDEMLERYRNDTRIMQIAGTNYLTEWTSNGYSYHFARWGSIWGWATWARAWNLYDVEIKTWKDPSVKAIVRQNLGEKVFKTREGVYNKICCNSSNISAWDHQWSYCRLINNGLTVVPSVNLVTNIGSGEDATHTTNMGNTSIEIKSLEFPLQHPPYIMRDVEFDQEIERKIFDIIPLWKKTVRKIKRMLTK